MSRSSKSVLPESEGLDHAEAQWRRQDLRHGGQSRGELIIRGGQYISLTAEPWSPEAITARAAEGGSGGLFPPENFEN